MHLKKPLKSLVNGSCEITYSGTTITYISTKPYVYATRNTVWPEVAPWSFQPVTRAIFTSAEQRRLCNQLCRLVCWFLSQKDYGNQRMSMRFSGEAGHSKGNNLGHFFILRLTQCTFCNNQPLSLMRPRHILLNKGQAFSTNWAIRLENIYNSTPILAS